MGVGSTSRDEGSLNSLWLFESRGDGACVLVVLLLLNSLFCSCLLCRRGKFLTCIHAIGMRLAVLEKQKW